MMMSVESCVDAVEGGAPMSWRNDFTSDIVGFDETWIFVLFFVVMGFSENGALAWFLNHLLLDRDDFVQCQ